MKATIHKIIQETPRVKTFVLHTEEPVSFTTGQAMRWKLPGVKVGRLYSVASPGGEDRTELEFTIRIFEDGTFTPHVAELQEGDTVELAGPFGNFLFDGSDGHDIGLIAGGSGISVLRSILRTVLDTGMGNNVHLLFSVLNVDEIIYKEELAQLAREHENFTYSVVVTEPHPEWDGRTGFVTADMFREDFGDMQQTFYVCGPEAFIGCVRDILGDAAVPEERIKVDQWTFYSTQQKGSV